MSLYDSMFTVANITSIQRALGVKNNLSKGLDTIKNNNTKWSEQNLNSWNALCKISK